MPASDFTTPLSATSSMARQRLPELHPEPVAPMFTTGLTNGSRRLAAWTGSAGLLSPAGLLSWTATGAGGAELVCFCTETAGAVATATGWPVVLTGAFCAVEDLNGSDFAGAVFTATAITFGALAAGTGFATTTA